MAEEKRFVKGLFKDSGHIDQMKGSWRHALNMIMNDKEGSLSNEGGTTPRWFADQSKAQSILRGQYNKCIGAIEVNDDRVVLFMCQEDKTTANGRDLIAMWDPAGNSGKGSFELLLFPALGQANLQLNFSINNPIEGTFKIDSKGDLIVYWTDDLNPPRAFNVDRQIREIPVIAGRIRLYGINPLGSHKNHIDLLNLFPNSGPVPHIELDDIVTAPTRYQRSIIEGGGLRTGVYYLALAYVDDDLVATNYLTVSNPVSIVDEYDWTKPTTKKDGAKDGNQTSKAIKWNISNLNTDYARLRPTVIRKMGDEIKAIKLNDLEIVPTVTTRPVVFSGIEGAAAGDLDKVIIDTVGYDTAKTISQLDGVLYVGNVTGTKDIGYQRYANNIKLYSVVHDIPNFDEFYATVDNLATGYSGQDVDRFGGVQQTVDESTTYRYVPNIYKYKGYMRSEVYAFYIAFIMNDGSMSYAYHIPGRDQCDPAGNSLNLTELAQPGGFGTAADFRALSEGYARNFHFFEYSFTGGPFAGLTTRNMNYWQNATEFYPNTDDFRVYDETGPIGSIKGLNVRHHHFPSNENDSRKVIDETHGCLTTLSEGLGGATLTPWSGTLIFWRTTWDHQWPKIGSGTGGHQKVIYNAPDAGNNPAMEAALWNGSTTFMADQDMNITVGWRALFHQTDPSDPTVKTYIYKTTPSGTSKHNGDTSDFNDWGCTDNYWDDRVSWNSKSGWNSNLMPGEYINIRSYKNTSSGSTVYHAGKKCVDNCTNYICYDSSCCCAFFKIEVQASGAITPSDVYNDAKISHTVRRLGFTLDDIKIPSDMADKVQGFRIYYAKRKHSDRTILGQAPLIPMMPRNSPIGICKEAAGDTDAMQILSATQNEPEQFYNAMPWAGSSWYYDDVNQTMVENTGLLTSSTGTTNGVNHNYAFMAFTFHDFYLLRTKSSIAGATHISPQFHVKNLVWNGPSLDQDKRMNTKLVKDKNTDPQILVPREEWGWDADNNCYARKIFSSIHMGMYYRTGYRSMGSGSANAVYRWPRVLGQKAKSYLKGDSIFNGKSLGFGGKILNLFGESSLIFKLKDNHGFNAGQDINAPGWGNCLNTPMYTLGSFTSFCTAADSSCGGYDPVTSCSGFPSGGDNNWGDWGHNHALNPPLLVNASDNAGGGPVGNRSTYMIANLDAFKTDVYKSIDSQELIWTGFQVVGDDIDNFIFDVDSGTALTNTHNGETADYSVATLQGSNWQNLEDIDTGIYGGDTFICRYGVVTSLTPSDISMGSNPLKGIHYHIVESTDNINFRHIESDKSLYFPATPTKDLLRLAGETDFTDQENIKYNDNYSELNDIRSAYPLPITETKQLEFPTRVHRSAKSDTSSVIDNWRVFLANQFKDLPKNRGDLWKLASFNNLLYFHMEESLLKTQGKQSMQMNDGSEAYVGSGDIFKQEPSEVVLTDDGYGGCVSQWVPLTTRFGHFFVDLAAKKVFLMKDKLQELSDLGLKKWFRRNLSFEIEQWGGQMRNLDNPIIGFGLHSVWDPKHRRIILTKRERVLNSLGAQLAANGASGLWGADYIKFSPAANIWIHYDWSSGAYMQSDIMWDNDTYLENGGWTISYYPELNVWVSLHSYVPYIYWNTSTNFYSMTDDHPVVDAGYTAGSLSGTAGTLFGNNTVWEHNSYRRGLIYQDDWQTASWYPGDNLFNFNDYEDASIYYPFEIEYIHNELRNVTSLYSSFAYTADVYEFNYGLGGSEGTLVRVSKHGFTSFFLYNSLQISGESTTLEYLINIRRIGNNWKVNQFRDMAALVDQTNTLNVPSTDPYYMSTNTNVVGMTNVGTSTTSQTNPMFRYVGVIKYPNPTYIDTTKNWTNQKKFIDKWLGIRLIYDNITNNLLNLYSTTVESRTMTR